jgi:NADP-dependent 3-hydroxy acid dehydrogenase YdfG
LKDIEDKVVAITGASSGIGAATAALLAARGAKIALGARDREGHLKEITAQILQTGGKAAYIQMDVSRRADHLKLVQLAIECFGKLDVFINCAGIAPISRFDELCVEDWDQMIDVNLKGTLYGIAAALPVFRKQNFGHFINIISTAGIQIVPTMGVYAGTKNAVRTITEALRQESGPNLRVTGISPGYVKTNLADSMTSEELKLQTAARMNEIAILPEDVARAVAFAIEQPSHVDIGDIVIRPTAQS